MSATKASAAAADAEAVQLAETETVVYTPEEILESMGQPDGPCSTSQTCRQLVDALKLQKEVLSSLRPQGDKVTMSQLDTVLCKWLKHIYLGISALPGWFRFNMLCDDLGKSGLLLPFISPVQVGDSKEVAIKVGVPTNLDPDLVCDNFSELGRAVAAAVLTFNQYLKHPATPEDMPADDACLVFTTLAIRSCQSAQVVSAVDAGLKELGVEGMSSDVLRWMMHFFRAELMGYFANVLQLQGDEEQYKDHKIAQQADYLNLIKVMPGNVMGYVRYVRSCLQFQQHQAAALFAAKGIALAQQQGAELMESHLRYMRAVAVGLGGAGPTFTGATLQEDVAAADVCMAKCLTWLHPAYHPLAAAEPEKTFVATHISPAILVADGGDVTAVEAFFSMDRAILPAGAIISGEGSS